MTACKFLQTTFIYADRTAKCRMIAKLQTHALQIRRMGDSQALAAAQP
jgi:hypothetical protein